jgi:hypothetical protein
MSSGSDASPTAGDEPARKLDRYGWYTGTKAGSQGKSKGELELEASENRHEPSRALKWGQMIAQWDDTLKTHFPKVAERVKKGIPDSVRGKAWQRILKMDEFEIRFPPIRVLVERAEDPCYLVIDQDLERTFPQVGFFSKPEALNSLRRLLRAYAHTDHEIGYVQGMSFIAGMLLHYMDVDSAFWSFCGIMRLHHREFFLPGFPQLNFAIKLLESLVEKHMPRVLQQCQENGVDFHMFCPAWFMPAFQGMDWAPDFQLRIFDLFTWFGLRGLLWIGLVIFKVHEKELAVAPMEEMMPLLQHPDRSEKMLNWRTALKKWEKLWVKKDEYDQLVLSVQEAAQAKAKKQRGKARINADSGLVI